jgi:hypothetical protein
MRILMHIFIGVLLGSATFFGLQNFQNDIELVTEQTGIQSVTKLREGQCLKGPSKAKVKQLQKISCESNFNYYIFSRFGFMHYEYDFASLKLQGYKYCLKESSALLRNALSEEKFKLHVFIPQFYEWKREVNYVGCAVHKIDFSQFSLNSIGYSV